MKIGIFRRNVAKTISAKAAKTALRTVSKNTSRVQAAQFSVALKAHTGQLLQTTGQYLLGLQPTQEMKDDAARVLGDIAYDLTALARVLKIKLPASTKKSKLVGTRSAAILQLDSLATDLLRQTEQSLFVLPKMTSVKKLVTMPQKGGVKEERNVAVVDAGAEKTAEQDRQNQMRSFLSGAVDVYWRLCYDMTGLPPAAVVEEKFSRMEKEFPAVEFNLGGPKPKAVAPPAPTATKAPKAKKKAEPVGV